MASLLQRGKFVHLPRVHGLQAEEDLPPATVSGNGDRHLVALVGPVPVYAGPKQSLHTFIVAVKAGQVKRCVPFLIAPF